MMFFCCTLTEVECSLLLWNSHDTTVWASSAFCANTHFASPCSFLIPEHPPNECVNFGSHLFAGSCHCLHGISANLIALDSRWPHKFQWWPTPVIGASESSTSTYHVLWQMSASYWLRDKVLISKTWRLMHCSKWRSSLSTPSADGRVLTLTMPCGTHRAGRPCA